MEIDFLLFLEVLWIMQGGQSMEWEWCNHQLIDAGNKGKIGIIVENGKVIQQAQNVMFFFLFVKSVHIYIFTDKKYKESWIINNTLNSLTTLSLYILCTVLQYWKSLETILCMLILTTSCCGFIIALCSLNTVNHFPRHDKANSHTAALTGRSSRIICSLAMLHFTLCLANCL